MNEKLRWTEVGGMGLTKTNTKHPTSILFIKDSTRSGLGTFVRDLIPVSIFYTREKTTIIRSSTSYSNTQKERESELERLRLKRPLDSLLAAIKELGPVAKYPSHFLTTLTG